MLCTQNTQNLNHSHSLSLLFISPEYIHVRHSYKNTHTQIRFTQKHTHTLSLSFVIFKNGRTHAYKWHSSDFMSKREGQFFHAYNSILSIFLLIISWCKCRVDLSWTWTHRSVDFLLPPPPPQPPPSPQLTELPQKSRCPNMILSAERAEIPLKWWGLNCNKQ